MDYKVTDTELTSIANAIRTKGGTSASMTFPDGFISAISAISGGGTPAVLESLTVSQNGHYTPSAGVDGFDDVVVNVSGGGGGSLYPWMDATYAGTLVGYEPYVTHSEFHGQALVPSSTYIEQAVLSGFSGAVYDLNSGKKTFASAVTKTISQAQAMLPVSDFTDMWALDEVAKEYAGYIYDTSKVTDLGLVLLGDFSQGGSASGNTLADSIENYSGVILQGIYSKNRTSQYNTSVLYQDIILSQQYWAGMKDRNNSYRCLVTFTDNTHVDLDGNKQVIIYGIL